MNWKDIISKHPIYLNLGGGNNHHPKIDYKNYISVDINCHNDWCVKHDLRRPIPLPDNSVNRILTEDFLEHIHVDDIKRLLQECFRIIKPKGMMRIGVPDYNNLKDRPYLLKGKDERFPKHVTLTHYELMKTIIEQSPFSSNYKFYHYWDREKFIYEKIDYSLGFIKRTPDNDVRCKKSGCELQITSIVVDIFKKR